MHDVACIRSQYRRRTDYAEKYIRTFRSTRVTLRNFPPKRNSRNCNYGRRSFVVPGNDGETAERASASFVTSLQRSHAFSHLTRSHCSQWQEFVLLQRPTKRSDVAAFTRGQTQDHLHQ